MQAITGDWNGDALLFATAMGAVTGGLSVGSSLGRFGLEAGLSVMDGATRAGFRGEAYGRNEIIADAVGGIVGEGVGSAARGLMRNADATLLIEVGRRGHRAELGSAGEVVEATSAASASGLLGRVLGWLKDDENERR